jgi:hypothetical protein
MLVQALALARRGLAVFPCGVGSKVPAGGHGHLEATTEPHLLRWWWKENPDYNIGIATGTVSGVWVLDVDGPEGEAALRELELEHSALPATIEAITGGGGRHLFFKMANRTIRNSVNRVGDHIDVRGHGGYVVAPPSLHPSGRRYAWSVDCAGAFADAPSWLIDKVAESSKARAVRAPAAGASGSFAVRAPEDWRVLVQGGSAEGSRNDTVTRLAGHLLRRRVDPVVTLELLQAWNEARCTPPLPLAEVERAVDSICSAELRRRGLQRHG